ncbi:MAG: hypothetical protein JW940_30180 [Polyangiaceae bacterium]|nr:hypothetical protein [Polyangiaceae bacterium]
MPATAELTRKHYCLGDHESRARFVVTKALSSAAVPEDLHANQTERAEEILRSGGR